MRIFFSEDSLADQDPFPHFRAKISALGLTLGDTDTPFSMNASHPSLISLPSYQSILLGRNVSHSDNEAPHVAEETLPARLQRELSLPVHSIATIAYWEKIRLAVAAKEAPVFVNAGVEPLEDGTDDPVFRKINYAQSEEKGNWPDGRLDKYTIAHTFHYLKKYRPRFLFVHLGDADEWGHLDDRENYLKTLRNYDQWLSELFELLALPEMAEYAEKTSLLVATDHGRGVGQNWTEHDSSHPHAEKVFLFASTPETRAGKSSPFQASYSHLDLRPTIEQMMGLVPRPGPGRLIEELLPSQPQKP